MIMMVATLALRIVLFFKLTLPISLSGNAFAVRPGITKIVLIPLVLSAIVMAHALRTASSHLLHAREMATSYPQASALCSAAPRDTTVGIRTASNAITPVRSALGQQPPSVWDAVLISI